jgi:anaerobic selenocysteine-containing dehydrogenase
MDDRYRGVFGRRDVVFMNQADLAAQGLSHGDAVTVETAFDTAQPARLEGFIVIAHDIARGSVAAYYPEANGLVPLSYHDPKSGTPSYKSVPVRILARPQKPVAA